MTRTTRIVALATVALLATWRRTGDAQRGGRDAAPPKSNATEYGALSYRYIGPPGNRVTSVAGVPGDSLTYYAGAEEGIPQAGGRLAGLTVLAPPGRTGVTLRAGAGALDVKLATDPARADIRPAAAATVAAV